MKFAGVIALFVAAATAAPLLVRTPFLIFISVLLGKEERRYGDMQLIRSQGDVTGTVGSLVDDPSTAVAKVEDTANGLVGGVEKMANNVVGGAENTVNGLVGEVGHAVGGLLKPVTGAAGGILKN